MDKRLWKQVFGEALGFASETLKAERSFVVFEGAGLARGLDTASLWVTGAISHTILRTLLEEQEALVMMDALADPRYREQTSAILSSLRSILYVPLHSPNRVVSGMLYLDTLTKTGVFGHEQLTKAKSFVANNFEPMLAELSTQPKALDWDGLTATEWL